MSTGIFCWPGCITIITVNTQTLLAFKVAHMNKLEKIDYKESSLHIKTSQKWQLGPCHCHSVMKTSHYYTIP